MSTDVFDQIPRAVTAREEKRLLKFQERLLHDKRATEKEENMVRRTKKFSRYLTGYFVLKIVLTYYEKKMF